MRWIQGVDGDELNSWRSLLGSALVALLVTDGLALAWLALATGALRTYGLALFLALPFCAPLLASLIFGARQRRTLGGHLTLSLAVVVGLALSALVVALEGVICILMAAPLAIPVAAAGGAVGYLLQPAGRLHRRSLATLAGATLLAPLLMGAERLAAVPHPLLRVRTVVDVEAPPAAVWEEVVAFAELPPPTEWVFRLGVAYPLRAEIDGSGPGAVRRCVFSTGAFVEPITVWDPPRHLAFSVSSQPAPMRELSPWGALHPPHLAGFLVSERGEFRLEPLAGGRTRLVGTTWYRHHMRPVAYWQWLSDGIIHRIHRRVLEQIRLRSEAAGRATRPA